MMPPASVPHMLPSPPMITASKPKDQPRRSDGGIEIGAYREEHAGDGDHRRATAPSPARRRGDCRGPISCATAGSSEVARKARPSAVR